MQSCAFYVQAQQDSLVADTIHAETPGVLSLLFKGKPGKAFVYSLILPGAGQVYNRSYWKVPIIYTGLGLLVYSIQFNSRNYDRFDKAYRLRVDSDKLNQPDTDEFKDILSLQGINSYRQFYDRNLQLSYIFFGVVYLLNGIEAFVDRHLQEFDISKNLSLQYSPGPNSLGSSISLQYKF